MLKKNDEKEGVVIALGADGEGVIKDDGFIVFVPFALEGEKIKYRVLKVKDNIAYGKVLEVLTPAENRIRPKCSVFGKCGGCRYQHLKYSDQLKVKENNVATCFKKIAGLEVKVAHASKGDSEFNYRNKLQLPVRYQNGSTIIGFYAENSHRVVPIDDCPINALWTENIISAFKRYVKEYDILGFDEETLQGDIREITVKEVKGKLLITVVSVKNELKCIKELLKILEEKIKYPFSLFLNINGADTNVVYGDEFRLIYGEPEYSSEMLGIKYKIGVRSFMQVNSIVCAKLYSAVCSQINADENTTVIDAYSGAGLMTALLAKTCGKAIGIEIVPEAVELANNLKVLNGLEDKMVNHLGKCEDILPKVIEEERKTGKKISVVLDPPRKGCELNVLEAIIKSGADKVVYVSCKPQTLARDIGLLIGSLQMVNGELRRVKDYVPRYGIELVKPYDMFAQTKHIETLVSLTKL